MGETGACATHEPQRGEGAEIARRDAETPAVCACVRWVRASAASGRQPRPWPGVWVARARSLRGLGDAAGRESGRATGRRFRRGERACGRGAIGGPRKHCFQVCTGAGHLGRPRARRAQAAREGGAHTRGSATQTAGEPRRRAAARLCRAPARDQRHQSGGSCLAPARPVAAPAPRVCAAARQGSGGPDAGCQRRTCAHTHSGRPLALGQLPPTKTTSARYSAPERQH